MPRVEKRSFLSGLSVKAAMRRRIVRLPQHASLDYCINRLIKYKINSILLLDDQQAPAGVISKTDLISAFYAGFPIDSPAENIMIGPPLFCYADDDLASSLDSMQLSGVHRLFVQGADSNEVIGVLAYPDIVGLLYRYCRACDKGLLKSRRRKADSEFQRLKVKDVMTATVTSHDEDDVLARIIEGLTAHHCGAVLIRDAGGQAVGVVSKTDLVVAYRHGETLEARAAAIMSTPVVSSHAQSDLVEAIQQMLLNDVQRIFVHDRKPGQIVGILSLSDAARFRSGSCKACTSSRLMQA